MPSPIDSSCIVRTIAAFSLYWSAVFLSPSLSQAQPSLGSMPTVPREKVIIDTDIGSNIDDAFAIALALHSPELDVLGFCATAGDTVERARVIDRMLGNSANDDIPILVGVAPQFPDKPLKMKPINRQKLYGEHERYASASYGDAVDFMREQIRRFPGEITLVTIGPLSNVGVLFDRDPQSFRKLKRVVMMGGWVGPVIYAGNTREPVAEYNVMADIGSARKLFNSGVPIYLMPIDSTIHLGLNEARRKAVFAAGTPLTDALAALYPLWPGTNPILYDVMAVMFALDPSVCPVEPMNIYVDEAGVTRVGDGAPNAQVCLHSDADQLLDDYLQRVTNPRGLTSRTE